MNIFNQFNFFYLCYVIKLIGLPIHISLTIKCLPNKSLYKRNLHSKFIILKVDVHKKSKPMKWKIMFKTENMQCSLREISLQIVNWNLELSK